MKPELQKSKFGEKVKYKHLFGPVPSRRLGMSLGVDLVPYKVCSLNCIYCEVGETTIHTLERKEYVSVSEVLDELDHFLAGNPELDYITFSGAGEPTLNIGIEEIISHIKENYPQYKLALLTNSTLLSDEKVREEIKDIDLLLPSLDAVSDDVFRKINNPVTSLKSQDIIDGLIEFKKIFKGEIWLEIFIVPGMNDTKEELKLFKKVLKQIRPERIQLNTLDRPGTKEWVVPSTRENLKRIAKKLHPLPVEIIAKFKSRRGIASYSDDVESRILETIRRRPCTTQDLADMLGLHLNEINKYLSELILLKMVTSEVQERGTFFRAL
ncbi:MAG: radical SAM protein [Candidatus Cloacimonadales bacterium]|nr:radical SAM protein [Candidatus Cloacimonadales bacterium]